MKIKYKYKRQQIVFCLILEQIILPFFLTIVVFLFVFVFLSKVGYRFKSELHLGIFLVLLVLFLGEIIFKIFRSLLSYLLKKLKKLYWCVGIQSSVFLKN